MRSTGIFFPALVASVLLSTAASAGVVIRIDKSTQQMSVSVDGATRYTWPVSTGRAGHATPSGSYTTFRLEEDHYSKEWDDAPMPHSIFFTPQGHAIHGSYETKRLGSPASHGCVRLAPANAARLFALVKEEGLANTKVVLSGEAAPMIARRPAQGDRQAAPLELQQYRSDPRAASPDTVSSYGESPAYPRQYAVEPRDRQNYAAQPGYQQGYPVRQRDQSDYALRPRYQPGYPVQQRYGQEYAAEPRYQDPGYGRRYERQPFYGQSQDPASRY